MNKICVIKQQIGIIYDLKDFYSFFCCCYFYRLHNNEKSKKNINEIFKLSGQLNKLPEYLYAVSILRT